MQRYVVFRAGKKGATFRSRKTKTEKLSANVFFVLDNKKEALFSFERSAAHGHLDGVPVGPKEWL